MPTFLQLWENMRRFKEENEENLGETPGMQAIRTGINQSPDFWQMFMDVCNNASHMADLLKVTPEQVGAWRSQVQQALQKVQDADKQPDETTEKGTNKEMIPTGGNLADPHGAENPKDGVTDTRPY